MKLRPLSIIQTFALAAFLAMGAGACRELEEGGTGSISAQAVMAPGPEPAGFNAISRVSPFNALINPSTYRATVTAADMSPLSQTTPGTATAGQIDDVPVGTDRTLTIVALDSVGTVLAQGTAIGLTVNAGAVTDAGTIILFETTPATIIAKSVSGSGYSMDGTWIACYSLGPTDFAERRVVSGTSITANSFNYTSTNVSCSAGETEDTTQAIFATVSNPTDFTVVGWSDFSASVAAPTAQDGVTTIPATPIVTLLDFSGTIGGIPGSGKMVMYIDDTNPAGNVIWYRSVGNPAACDPSSTGSEQCLFTLDFFIKQ